MDGRFKWCNSATLLALGLRREEFIGRRLIELVYEPDREVIGEKLRTGAIGRGAKLTRCVTYPADGRLRYARVDNSPLVVEGRTTGVLGIARDITEQKEERERAARADKLRALGQLASGVAHDFNNSLAAILGRAQLLRRQTQDEALVRNVEIIQTAAEDAAATVRRIQTFARKSPAREFEMLDVSSLLNDAIEITRTRWENEARLRGLDYQVVLDAESGQHTCGSASRTTGSFCKSHRERQLMRCPTGVCFRLAACEKDSGCACGLPIAEQECPKTCGRRSSILSLQPRARKVPVSDFQ